MQQRADYCLTLGDQSKARLRSQVLNAAEIPPGKQNQRSMQAWP
jgi:hypothetical protein